MKYNDYKNKIKSGDLLAWSTRGIHSFMDLVTFIIRLVTQSEYEHVGIAWVVSGRIFVIEAINPAIRIYPLSKGVPFYVVPMDVEWTAEREQFLLSKVGDPYSIWHAVKSVFTKLKVEKEWQCAQLALEFYKEAGIDLGDKATPSEVVYRALERSNNGLQYLTK